MAIDGFLAIPDIQGESLRDGHEGEIEFHGLSFGMATAVSAGETMSRRRGRATLDSVTVVKHYDRASPSLKKMVFDARLARVADLMVEPVRRMLQRQALAVATRRLRVEVSAMGEEAGAMGAAALVLDGVFQIPQLKIPEYL